MTSNAPYRSKANAHVLDDETSQMSPKSAQRGSYNSSANQSTISSTNFVSAFSLTRQTFIKICMLPSRSCLLVSL